MSERLKIFLIACVLSLPSWWGVNLLERKLEEFFFLRSGVKNLQVLIGEINRETKRLKSLRPVKKKQAQKFDLRAKAGICVFITSNKRRVLFKKAEKEKLPIASLTKLMTAFVVLEHYDLDQIIKINKEAIKTEEELGNLRIGERFFVKDLLYPLLIESSNDAAAALAQLVGEEAFVDLMNFEAKDLGLKNTYFANPTGLDEKSGQSNFSTAEDLIDLSYHLLKKYPKIFKILSFKEFELYSLGGLSHHLTNKNKLLGEIPEIVGGKTGYTQKAKGCLLLINKKNEGFLISLILGSDQKFKEMEDLLNWINEAYRF